MFKRFTSSHFYLLLLILAVFGASSTFAIGDDSEYQSRYFKKLDSLSNNAHKFSYEKDSGSSLLKLQKRLSIREKKVKKVTMDKSKKNNVDYKALFREAYSKYSKNY